MFSDYAFHETMFHAFQWYLVTAEPGEPGEPGGPDGVSGLSGLSGLSALVC